jgi:hypothetical protein
MDSGIIARTEAWNMARSMIAVATLVVSTGTALGQNAVAEAAPYCADLKRVVALATSRLGFESIAGQPRNGSFRDTILPLTGWRDCSLYGSGTYTCDSGELGAAEAAEKAQAQEVDRILACLAGAWAEIKDRSSPGYVVLHPATGAASMTLSLDRTEKHERIMRLTLFLRSR